MGYATDLGEARNGIFFAWGLDDPNHVDRAGVFGFMPHAGVVNETAPARGWGPPGPSGGASWGAGPARPAVSRSHSGARRCSILLTLLIFRARPNKKTRHAFSIEGMAQRTEDYERMPWDE
jgi:hypothetical protein